MTQYRGAYQWHKLLLLLAFGLQLVTPSFGEVSDDSVKPYYEFLSMLSRQRDADRPIIYYSNDDDDFQLPILRMPKPFKRVPGSEFLGKRVPGSEFLGKRVPGSEFLGKRVPGSEFLGKRVPGSEFLGKRVPGSEFLGKRVPGSEFLGKRSGSLEFTDGIFQSDRDNYLKRFQDSGR